ncbi:hypothetical protein HYPBUDRAFT_231687 [Hyphopichia burtonii NRRL Y-1933]|uniref:Uncharacterized protein n=1 Tax=Hyphopichia burtonii NRRL Y-1933 TaxID=984485 RepID=A0A1E4RDB5_9ASCO|nr:hypothetical protein HYPBUDRAFT_231687 [Hyphopichia burtonii NRRL Y-1933]ODV65240.1 hypothetical protein HYPBUDRAFT_231687 [Hyphopichia burtonii NRRL Y-1933]
MIRLNASRQMDQKISESCRCHSYNSIGYMEFELKEDFASFDKCNVAFGFCNALIL